jgi:endonuclease III
MKKKDVELCRSTVRKLSSTTCNDKIYLFLKPVDFQTAPGYRELVKTPMDLATLSQNLEEGRYKSRSDFFADARLIFENAIVYNENLDSDWIVPVAKSMLEMCLEEEAGGNEKNVSVEKEELQAVSGSVVVEEEAVKSNKRKASAGRQRMLPGTSGRKTPTGKTGAGKATTNEKSIANGRRDKRQKKKELVLAVKNGIEKPPGQNTERQNKSIEEKATSPKRNNIQNPLPNDGSFDTWVKFGEGGGYGISVGEWKRVHSWVVEVRSKPDVVADRVALHRLVVEMKKHSEFKTARDEWVKVLPPFHRPNFFWCTLMLMMATPKVPDTKIIDVFGKLFKNQVVDEDWVIELGQSKLAKLLQPMGMQNQNAKYIIQAAVDMKKMKQSPRDYRQLAKILGVGPKIALVTIQETTGQAQGIPCDIHMCRIFTILDWIPSSNENNDTSSCLDIVESENKKQGNYNYEMARAAMEGWFPASSWSELNQTWAGLGQLLNLELGSKVVAEYVDKETASVESPWRVADKASFIKILVAYSKL